MKLNDVRQAFALGCFMILCCGFAQQAFAEDPGCARLRSSCVRQANNCLGMRNQYGGEPNHNVEQMEVDSECENRANNCMIQGGGTNYGCRPLGREDFR